MIRDDVRRDVERARWGGVRLSIVGISFVAISSLVGCGAAPDSQDERLSPPSSDEYTEPMTNAVIGSPTGLTKIAADGTATVLPPGTGAPPVSVGGSSSGSGGMGGSSSGIGPIEGDDGGTFGDDGGGVTGEGGVSQPGGFGQWHFDDCSPDVDFLIDSSGEGDNAQHKLKSACVPGISGLGVGIRSAKDLIEVPDSPQFTVGPRIAVAAWVHPNTTDGNQPVVIKRLGNQTSFSLGIHNGNIEMSVVLVDGTTYVSRAPIASGAWTHVAGMFDGTFVWLLINGQPFGQVYAAGTIRNEAAPIRIGATSGAQFLDGIVDEVFVSTQPTSLQQLAALACISRPTTFAVNPPASGPVPADTAFHYDVAVSDNDVGFCTAKQYDVFTSTNDPGISAQVEQSFQQAEPNTTVHFGIDVTGSDDADPGVHVIPVNIFNFGSGFGGTFENLVGQLNFELQAPTGCFVTTRRELFITDTSVVDDPVRAPDPGATSPGSGFGDGGVFSTDSGVAFGDAGGIGPPPFPPGFPLAAAAGNASTPIPDASIPAFDAGTGNGGSSPSAGVWSFGSLIRAMAKSPDLAPRMTEQLFDTWLSDQTVNGFTVAARPAMQQLLLDIWPRTPDGQLDLDRAPLRLQAIVNRIDLRNLAAGSAGEGRFVFGVDDGNGNPQDFTLILEYNLPATTAADVTNWANLWHGLQTLPFPSEAYNAALEAITRRFAGANAQPSGVNGSALVTLRTNELVLSNNGRWELREFGLSPTTGFLQEVTVKETPDLGFNDTSTFSDFVNQNAAAIIGEVPGATGVLPASFEGKPFMAGSVFNDLVVWNGPGIANPDARFHASINTCNGCHGPDTNTSFLMVNPRSPGTEAVLSSFITGTIVFDQTTGEQRVVNDLARRKADLTAIVCGPDEDGGPLPPPPTLDAGPPSFDGGGPITGDAGPVSVGGDDAGTVVFGGDASTVFGGGDTGFPIP